MLKHNAHGIDISDNNGDLDWHSWDGQIEFAMIKHSEGTDIRDPLFDRNWAAAKAIGCHRFAYHFARPDGDPAAQARYFLKDLDPQLDDTDNFMLDLEVTEGMSPMDVSFWAYVFCLTVHHRHPLRKILIYTFPAFAEAGNCAMLGGLPLAIANFDVAAPTVPVPWSVLGDDNWRIWQYVAGSSATKGGLDRDLFNGGSMALEDFCIRA